MPVNLWTPSRTRLADPFCERCGGVTRDWMRDHRRHAGFSLHRACCCEVNCLGAIEITVSGVDAAMCSGCIGDSNLFESRRYDVVRVDGTYLLDDPHAGPSSNDRCTASQTFVNAQTTVEAERWNNSDSCSGASDVTITSNSVKIEVDYNTVDKTLFFVRLSINAGGYLVTFFNSDRRQAGETPVDFGDPLANEVTCGGSAAASNGGTAIASEP